MLLDIISIILSLGALIFTGWIFLIAFKKLFLEDSIARLKGIMAKEMEHLKISQVNGFNNLIEKYKEGKIDVVSLRIEQEKIRLMVKSLSDDIKKNGK